MQKHQPDHLERKPEKASEQPQKCEDGESEGEVQELNPFPFAKKYKPQPQKTSLLAYQDSDIPMQPALPPKSVIHKYHLLDDNKMRLTNNFNLAEKLSEVLWEPEPEPGEAPSPKLAAEPKKKLLLSASFRYFTYAARRREQAICRSCRGKGHVGRHCSAQQKDVCIHCLGYHSKFFSCQQSFVNPPFGPPENGGSVHEICKRCERSGHLRKKCGYLTKAASKSRAQQTCELSTEFEEVVCLRCEKKGHLNCSPEPKSTTEDGVFTSIPLRATAAE